jgi:phosphopantetheine--protein transferase-like protein
MDAITIGIDIVDIQDIQKKIKSSDLLLDTIFSVQEIDKCSIESIAGKIAAKEAVVKTGYMKPGEWKSIMIVSLETGAPIICDPSGTQILNIHISISHTDATAVAVALYEKDNNH